ncbi:hypothetical protein CFC21_055372 [Triticum aestivum]|uniref:DUF295 domain-containing protein n=2 Tax=Triticum aestivum TaxID=4565 RepID=A0A9R1KA11_WHEAT|nr:hypothetical protein CFC21_055372 [Triticum aestivum]
MEAQPREIFLGAGGHCFLVLVLVAHNLGSSSWERPIMQIMANRTCSASASSLFASSRPQGWAELPDDLLRPIVALLRSFRDLLAFGTTCRHWCDLFSARRSSLQPLLLHPNLRTDGGQTLSHNCWTLFHKGAWRLADPAATSSSRSFLSLSDLRSMTFLRYSHGQLIFYDNNGFHIVNPFSGTKVGPPSLQSVHFTCISYVTLTAPVASTDSHLLVGAGAYLFLWRIGSDSWTKHSPKVVRFSIEQNVAFKGKTYALGSFGWFYIIHLSPSLIVEKFKVVFEEDKTEDLYSANEKAWLLVCGDTLLLIKLVEAGRRMRSEAFQFMPFKLESLDTMTKKARWVKVNKLDNWAIFISIDERCKALPCMNPEGWGGRSNHIYFPSYQSEKPWAAVQLWEKCYYRSTQLFNTGRRYLKLESTWVFPARFLVTSCDDLTAVSAVDD